MRQKRIALINDVTGYSRCSIAAQLPIISRVSKTIYLYNLNYSVIISVIGFFLCQFSSFLCSVMYVYML